MLGFVDVQEIREPAEEQGRRVACGHAHLDLPDGSHGLEVGDQAEHPFGRVREQFIERMSVGANPDVGRVLDFFVSHAATTAAEDEDSSAYMPRSRPGQISLCIWSWIPTGSR